MPEIDPQSENRLTESLRHLAAASRRDAPDELGAGLLTAFRKHHARRRRIRRTGISTVLALCLAVIAVAISMRTPPQKQPNAANAPQVAPVAPTANAPETAPAVKNAATQPKSTPRHRPRTATSVAANRPFLALPGYDPAVPVDQLHVVRVHLPASELWQIGAPVSAGSGTRSMTADFVISQGGTPYAVRLVQ